MGITIRKKVRKNKTSLYLDINIGKYRKWEPTGLYLTGNKTTDKMILDKCEIIRAKRLLEIADGKFGLYTSGGAKPFLPYYKKMIEERPEYERRVSIYKHMVNFFAKENKTPAFLDIDESFWNKFKHYLTSKEQPYNQTTLHTTISILKSVLNRAVRDKVIKDNPLKYVSEKRPKTTRTYLTFEELLLLKKTPCNPDVKNAFFFSCYTGLRKSDVKLLKKSNLANGYIIKKMKKTGDDVVIPYDDKVKAFLPDNIDSMGQDEYLFRLPAWSTVSIIIKDWAMAAGITKQVTYHTSRHTFATLNLTSGTSVEVLRDLMGHKDVRETQIYAKIIDENKKKAIDNLPELK